MLVRSELNVNVRPEIQLLVDEIIKENSRYNRELRSFHRDVLVCPVEVRFSDDLEDRHCVSRNISPAGISLISPFEFEERVVVSLKLHRLKETRDQWIVAECRWCKPFGQFYWMSGWQFVRLQTSW